MHDYPEQFAAGLKPQAVRKEYSNVRRSDHSRSGHQRRGVLPHDRQLGSEYGLEFAEAFHYIYIGPPVSGIENHLRRRVVPLK